MIKCPFCGSTSVIKSAVIKNKRGLTQRYKCKNCHRHFVRRDGFVKMKTPPSIVITALDLRAKGLSFGKIKQHLYEIYGRKVERSTIYYWQKSIVK